MQGRTALAIGAALAAALAIAAVLIVRARLGGLAAPAAPETRPLPGGGDFTLASATGPVALADLRGRVPVLAFGYTTCPDVCPATLGTLTAALRALTAEELARVVPVFVSLDPERDTVERLASYVGFFHPAIRGVTGTPAAIAEVARRYEVTYARTVDARGSGYWLDHSAELYVLDRAGRPAFRLPHDLAPERLVAAIRATLGRAGPVAAPAATAPDARAPPTAAAAAGITATDPVVRLVPPESPTSALFARVHNGTDAPRAIVAAHSAAARRVELHAHIDDGGVMRMRQVDRIELPAHGDAVLQPGGFHVMLIDLIRPLTAGETLAIELELDDGTRVPLAAPVRAPTAGPAHGHGM